MPTNPEVVEYTPYRKQCIDDTVALLEQMLERAKRGDFVSVAVLTVLPDLSVDSFWSKMDNLPSMLGAVQVLNQRLLRAV